MITRLAAFLGGLRRVRCNFNMTVLFFEGHILHKILQELIVNPHYLQVLYRFQVIFQILSINRRMMLQPCTAVLQADDLFGTVSAASITASSLSFDEVHLCFLYIR